MCKMYLSPELVPRPCPVPPAPSSQALVQQECQGMGVKHGNSLGLLCGLFFFLSFSTWILITGLNLQPWEREGSNVQVMGRRKEGSSHGASFRGKSPMGVRMGVGVCGVCSQRAVLPGQSSWGCREHPAQLWPLGEAAVMPRPSHISLPHAQQGWSVLELPEVTWNLS